MSRMRSPLASLGEAVKSFCIFLLIVIMLVLLVLLMIGQNDTAEETLPTADRMVVYASGAQQAYASGMESARVLPELFAFRADGGALSVLYGTASMAKPYAAVYPLIRELFGAGAVCMTVPAEHAGALWNACRSLDAVLYLDYNGALPAAVIRAYTYGEEDGETPDASLDEAPEGNAAYVGEVFFVSAVALASAGEPFWTYSGWQTPGADEICAVALDAQGSAALFRSAEFAGPLPPDDPVEAETAPETETAAYAAAASVKAENAGAQTLLQYIETVRALSADAQPGAFSAEDTADKTTGMLLSGVYRMPQLVLYGFDPAQVLYPDAALLSSVLGALGMRESDTDNYYTDGSGNRIYLNSRGRLTLSGGSGTERGMIRYAAAQDGGLEISDYLGYASVGGGYLLSEYLRAADRMLSQLETLEPALGGTTLQCTLYDARMTAFSDGVVMTYIYTMNGIPLLDAAGEVLTAMVLRAGNGVFTGIELYPCTAEVSEQQQYLLPQTVAMDALRLELAETLGEDAAAMPQDGSMRIGYLPEEMSAGDGAAEYRADWLCRLQGGG